MSFFAWQRAWFSLFAKGGVSLASGGVFARIGDGERIPFAGAQKESKFAFGYIAELFVLFRG